MQKDRTPPSNHVPILSRALLIAETLAASQEGLSLQQLSDATDIPRNTVYRILITLRHAGYVSQFSGSSRYRLTHKWVGLACASVDTGSLVETALPYLRSLRDDTAETIVIGTMLGSEGVVLEQVPGTHPFKFTLDIGMRFHLHASGPGKCMLAWSQPSDRARMLRDMDFAPMTPHTLKREQLVRDLEVVLQRGWAYDLEEYMLGCRCVAAPIRSPTGEPLAAIWITGPSARLTDEMLPALGEQVKEHAEWISQALAHLG